MEAVAQMFEAEEGMHCEVEQKMKSEPYLWMQPSFPCIQGKYRPYCEIMSSINQNVATGIKMSMIRRSSAQGKQMRNKKKKERAMLVNRKKMTPRKRKSDRHISSTVDGRPSFDTNESHQVLLTSM
ncbi:hypothetical protein HAX54_034067 [Datura stramonium]|uniref:Uncharacterized protein n=1 Tax=Datura stramonium TaxID=4076 RepID=A0ABS8SDW1_DATST|nr:hypothetical protein [Datura stramonium]